MKPVNLNKILARIESNWILKAMNASSNNRQYASHLLGINRTTLVEKLRRRGWLKTMISDKLPSGLLGRKKTNCCMWCGERVEKAVFCDEVCRQKYIGAGIDSESSDRVKL